MKIYLVFISIIISLSGGLYYSTKKSMEYSNTIDALNDVISQKDKAFKELEEDYASRASINKELMDKIKGIEEERRRLIEENKKVFDNIPKIVDETKVIDDKKYVEIKVLDNKLDEYYKVLFE